MLASLGDPYTRFLSPEEVIKFKDDVFILLSLFHFKVLVFKFKIHLKMLQLVIFKHFQYTHFVNSNSQIEA